MMEDVWRREGGVAVSMSGEHKGKTKNERREGETGVKSAWWRWGVWSDEGRAGHWRSAHDRSAQSALAM